MGTHVNPGNSGFAIAVKGDDYIDKTGLVSFINSVLDTTRRETTFTRPRRFGKTTACNMLAAYYSVGCDSSGLFKGREIEADPSYEAHLNKHPVIYFDLLSIMSDFTDDNPENLGLKKFLNSVLSAEVAQAYPKANANKNGSLKNAMLAVSNSLKDEDPKEDGNTHKFIVIIDEWDIPLREHKENLAMVEEYMEFLRSIFRSKDTANYLAGAYMTGILPIIRYNTQSALSDFWEYTMIDPGPLARYVGFTGKDVLAVCRKYKGDPERMKEWYDGYHFPDVGEVYCPSSVIKAAISGSYTSYWTVTAAMESLTDYIYTDFDGLKEAMNVLLDGKEVEANTRTFENRLDRVDSRDKVLTVLVHLGYLAYDSSRRSVRIPNTEVRLQMLDAFSQSPSEEFFKRIRQCDKVLKATRRMDEKAVAALISEIHDDRPPIHYNDEQALRYVVLSAYNNSPNAAYVAYEELSSGRGFVDILFKPEPACLDPAILVELRYNRSAKSAIADIHGKNYLTYLEKEGYHGDVLLVGINYSSKTKKHTCLIEKATI